MVLEPVYLPAGFVFFLLIFVVGVFQRLTLFKSGFKVQSIGLLLLSLIYAALLYPAGLLRWSLIEHSSLEGYAIALSLQVAASLWLTFVSVLAILEVVRLRMPWQVGLTYLLLWPSLILVFEVMLAGAFIDFHVFWPAALSIYMMSSLLAAWVQMRTGVIIEFAGIMLGVGILFFVLAVLFTALSVLKRWAFQAGKRSPRYPAVASVVYAVGLSMLIGSLLVTINIFNLVAAGALTTIGVILVGVANSSIIRREKEQKEKAEKEEVEKLRKRVEELEQKTKTQ